MATAGEVASKRIRELEEQMVELECKQTESEKKLGTAREELRVALERLAKLQNNFDVEKKQWQIMEEDKKKVEQK